MNNQNELTEIWITENIKELSWLSKEFYSNFDFLPDVDKVYTAYMSDTKTIYGIFITDFPKSFFYFEYINMKGENKNVENFNKEITDIESLIEIWKVRQGIDLAR
ncbi:MAG TPA: hypothetical protein PKD42_13225 [Chitinophagaceae bacterium]|nr:hypothetical protein [Chitinophagaceae bacterium]